jgi:hypothetical protein
MKRKEFDYELQDALKWARETTETSIKLGDLNQESTSQIDAYFTRRSTIQLRRLVKSGDARTKRDALKVLVAYALVEEELLS